MPLFYFLLQAVKFRKKFAKNHRLLRSIKPPVA